MTTPVHPRADWYPDPLGRGAYRYWDGGQWTLWIADDGVSRRDAAGVPAGLAAPNLLEPTLPAQTTNAPPSPGTAAPLPVPMTRLQPSDQPRYRPVGGLTTALTWLLGASILSALALAVACGNRLSKVNAFDDRRTFAALSDIDHADDLVSTVATILGIITIAIFVVFVVDLYRASKNTELWNTSPRRWTPGWTIAGWCIPLANFVIPALVVGDLWRRTPEPAPVSDHPRNISSGIVWLWWVLFVIGIVGSRVDIDPDTLNAARAQDWINIVASITLAASAVPLIVIVRTLARRQQHTAFPSTRPV